ncbi:Hsp20/alpha crystallin family protein [Candidatus Persebacteraceae bacterium Df01]|jgi:HSP20 family protein|uniref:Hsp20/alpha crystallin family protein n=1 Tax=Candidatus Doriopsillibacter californiensis TaxID=2970740 RepID=A0ABT7QL76_9GAMM|nr:Hsp20/alpha crystallin family protein [Candidatus Persebacteraceae bacterium Df01]
MHNLYKPFDRFLQSVERDFPAASSAGFRVNIKESEAHYHLSADLPGVTKKDVSVNVENGVLSISALFKQEEGDMLHSERLNGSYERTFRLSDKIAAESIEAAMKDGVLTLTIPKGERIIKRQIAIN